MLDKELRPDERQMVLAALARLRPSKYLAPLVETALHSRSIKVQQMAVAVLPELVGEGLAPELGEQVERWLRRRLANPRRENTWAAWEIPGVALALLPSHGTDRIVALLDGIAPRMQPDERQTWSSLRPAANLAQALHEGLTGWFGENHGVSDAEPRESDLPDPTADVYVDRVMKQLGYRPTNSNSPVYDPPADFEGSSQSRV